MAGGVGLFLYGMFQLEDALRKMAGRTFKLFLKRATQNPLKAIAGGTVVTAVLQSSSVVSLMVLAFVGAGVLSMRNALAVILGSNLGTTLDSWVVATVGFKFDIDTYSYPLLGIAVLVYALFSNNERIKYTALFLSGVALLFIGLGIMKASMAGIAKSYVLPSSETTPLIVFVLIGFVVTFVIQSSSATIAITLTALHSHAIDFPASLAVVIGSEVGTTIKIIAGAINGIPAKKRVAIGNFVYNLAVSVLAFLLIKPIAAFITGIVGITDNMIGLVFFQTLINLSGIILFFPFLNYFGRWLESLFTSENNRSTYFIHNTHTHEPETCTTVLRQEVKTFHAVVLYYQWLMLSANGNKEPGKNILEQLPPNKLKELKPEALYTYVRTYYGEIHEYCTEVKQHITEAGLMLEFDALVKAVRDAMYAAKAIKDIAHNIDELQRSSNNIKFRAFENHAAHLHKFITALYRVWLQEETGVLYSQLQSMKQEASLRYKTELAHYYSKPVIQQLDENEITTLLNVNREVRNTQTLMINATASVLLKKEEAVDLEQPE